MQRLLTSVFLVLIVFIFSLGELPAKAAAVDLSLRTEKHFEKFSMLDKSGPNCFNTVLMVAGLSPYIRHVGVDEFLFRLNSISCTPINDRDQIQPGDIGTIWMTDPSRHLFHAFVFLDNNSIFHKPSDKASDSIEFSTMTDIENTYSRCLFHIEEPCHIEMGFEILRCDFNRVAIDISPFDEVERKLENLLLNEDFGINELNSLFSEFEQIKSIVDLTVQEIKYSAKSIQDQFEYLGIEKNPDVI